MGSTPAPRRRSSVTSVAYSLVSATERVLDSDLPPGFLAATAEITSQAPTISDIRTEALAQQDAQRNTSRSNSRKAARASRTPKDLAQPRIDEHEHQGAQEEPEPFPPLTEESTKVSGQDKVHVLAGPPSPSTTRGKDEIAVVSQVDRAYTSGYIPPRKRPWTTSASHALKGFWSWFLTPFGFLVTIYGLNVVAWGGMLFLLLCKASPAMCHAPDPKNPGQTYFNCDDVNSPAKKWLEIDSQILNALFCVTGLGLVPWRFRDLWFILCYRFTNQRKSGLEKKMFGLRKLAGYYRAWMRLPGHTTIDQMSAEEYIRSLEEQQDVEAGATLSEIGFDPRVPVPGTKAPPPPLSGVRAPATKLWKVDFFIWCQVFNTFFQICLCFFMWNYNRINRPSWATGLFVALACGVAGIGGLVSYLEGKAVKRVEGYAPSAGAQEAVAESRSGESRQQVECTDEKAGEDRAAL